MKKKKNKLDLDQIEECIKGFILFFSFSLVCCQHRNLITAFVVENLFDQNQGSEL